jgi:hypothetical protein
MEFYNTLNPSLLKQELDDNDYTMKDFALIS